LILQNRRLTNREIGENVGISFGSRQAIPTEKLNMQRVAAKFVPRVLIEDQKANRVNISQEMQFSGEKCTPAILLSRFGSSGLFSFS
jgi:hypothetical protein